MYNLSINKIFFNINFIDNNNNKLLLLEVNNIGLILILFKELINFSNIISSPALFR